jgi:hypothetical protein
VGPDSPYVWPKVKKLNKTILRGEPGYLDALWQEILVGVKNVKFERTLSLTLNSRTGSRSSFRCALKMQLVLKQGTFVKERLFTTRSWNSDPQLNRFLTPLETLTVIASAYM